MEAGPGFGELAGLTSLKWLRKDRVAIVIVQDHDIVVAARGLDGELASLIGVGLVEIGCLENTGEDDVGAFVARFLRWTEIKGRCQREVGCDFG